MSDAETNRFRKRRMERFLALVDPVIAARGEAHILDVGGTIGYWRALEPLWRGRNLRFTIVNMGVEDSDDGVYAVRGGDARAMDRFADNSFDIVHSNSVIEHVGHWREMKAMAGEVRRLAPAYFLQTPNIWFPIEAHFSLPFVHWLPEQTRVAILRARRDKYLPYSSGIGGATELVQRVNLLSLGQMRELFPDAEIERERVLGLTKSWIAVRRAA